MKQQNLFRIGATAVGCIVLAAVCAFTPTTFANNSLGDPGATDRTITVMSYNVENLFDAEHDPGKEDYHYLPATHPEKTNCASVSPRYRQSCFESDWTDERIGWKLNQIKKVFTAMGTLPDILGVQEVENLNILTRLGNHLGFDRVILEEGPDRRGIDVGLLFNETKLEYVGHQSYAIDGPEFEVKPTRDILAVYFRIRALGSTSPVIGVYVNHWPSQGNPSSKRVIAAEKLKNYMLIDKNRFGADRFHAVILGDFNTVPDDFPHPIKGSLLNGGVIGTILDSRTIRSVQPATAEFALGNPGKPQPIGTYFYPPKMAWQYLDRIFVSQSLNDGSGIDMQAGSFHIFYDDRFLHTFQYNRADLPLFGSLVTGVPKRFSSRAPTEAEMGFSDHLPISIKISY